MKTRLPICQWLRLHLAAVLWAALLLSAQAQVVSTVQVTTLAGSGTPGSADGTGTAAQFDLPQGVAVDGTGNVYVADELNHLIRKITPAGVVTTLVGSGRGFADGTGAAAQFDGPTGVAVDAAGNVYVGDYFNDRIRKITPAGVVTTLAGSSRGFADGTGAAAQFDGPTGVAVDAAGNVYVGDLSNHRIRKITPAGVVTTLAGSSQGFADGTGAAALFNQPHGVAVDGAGNFYVADSSNQRIRKITPAGVVTTLAGSSGGFADGTGTTALFSRPYGVAVDAAGNVYVADHGNDRIRTITPAGVVTTLAGGSQGFADGTGTAAQFANPFGVAVDGAGNVYVADELNHRIRKVTNATAPTITTQPLSQTVAVGSNATFSVVATGAAPLSYQWRKEGLPIAGATNDFLTLSNIQPADAGSYDVAVSNAAGTTTSSSARLSIAGAPTITTQPLSRTVTQGSTVNFSVGIATSATLPLRYQWRHNGSDIPGAINPVFTLANAQPSAAGLYSVLVANSFGTNVSAEAALFVSSPPMVVAHPTNQSVTLGSNVTFTVVASGGMPLTYQWRVNGAPIPGANNQSLTITGAQLSSAGIYDVLVSDGTFSVFSSSAVLTVLPPFAITPQPVGMATNVGGSATFTVGAVGLGTFNGPFTYQWTFNGTTLVDQTNSSLAFTGLALVNSGNYACVVHSPLGSITSSNALLTVFNPFSVGTTSFQPGGLFQMTASGDDGRAYRLESSTNLVIWTAVVTNTVSGGTATFTDSTAAGNVLRFYRIVLLP